MNQFTKMLIAELRQIFGTTKRVEPSFTPGLYDHSIKGAFHTALLVEGWEHENGRYRKTGFFNHQLVPMADAILAQKYSQD